MKSKKKHLPDLTIVEDQYRRLARCDAIPEKSFSHALAPTHSKPRQMFQTQYN